MSVRTSLFKRIAATALAAVVSVSAFGIFASADEAPVTPPAGKTETKTLYTVGNTAYENGGSTRKGNGHDCQHLGVWVPKGTTFKIRQTNTAFGQDMTFKMRNDDSQHETVHTLKKDGSWLEVTPEYDSVPFISSLYSANGEKPVVEFSVKGTQELPVYEFGDDEEAFFKKWDELDAPFAVYLSEKYAIFLVPERDKKNNKMGSLDDLMLWYDNMVAQYNAFSGLSEDAEQEWNRDSGTRYFIKANRNGIGAAYYSVVETAPNSESLLGYMVDTNWGPLHEVGHGYDTVNFGSAEIWNNVLSHYYQISAFGEGNWLRLSEEQRAHYEDQRDSVGYWNSNEYDTKLYFWVNMLDKLGPQKTSAYAYQLYRGNKANGIENLSGHNFYADAYTKGSGYNVTAWFDMWGFEIDDDVREGLIEDNCYQNVYPLRNLVSDDDTADKIATALGLDSKYSLVETQELVNYYKNTEKISGTLSITFDTLSFSLLKGQTVRITDGEHTVKELLVTSDEMTVEMPVGLYNVILPGASGEDPVVIENRVNYAVVTEGAKTVHPVTAKSVTGGGDYIDWEILFNSTYTYNGTFCKAVTDIANKKLHITAVECQPHTYIDNYAYIKVFDKSGTEVFSKECSGKGTTALDKTITIQPGYTIEIYQAEPARGYYVQSVGVNSHKLVEYNAGTSYPDPTRTYTFKVTEFGLESVTPTAVDGETNYYNVLAARLDELKEQYSKADFQNPLMFPNEKAELKAAIAKLSDENQSKLSKAYRGYYPFDKGVYPLTISAIANQSYNGKEIKPTLTVHAGSVLLPSTSYTVKWSSNVDVGTAKIKVDGLGNYSNYTGEASFEIVLPANLSGGFTVKSDVKAYEYSGGTKRPSATVTISGRTLERNVDYILSYEKNVEIGTAKVIATGMGNYKGVTGSGTFEIVEKGTLPKDDEEEPNEYAFKDVKETDYFFEAVNWAVENEITNGMGNNEFRPKFACTRADAVTFLWRAAGCPESTVKVNHFKDVKEGQYYYEAVMWAIENGITTGTSLNYFSPKATVTRAEMVTFMFRMEQTEEVVSGETFSDIGHDDYFADSVAWAVNKGITNGMGNGKFEPMRECTRAQIVTMLYRNLPAEEETTDEVEGAE